MGFLDELKKLTRPYDEEDDDYIDDAEVVNQPEPDRPRPNPFAGFGGGSSAQSAPQASPARPREGKVVNFGAGGGQSQVVLIKPERFETAAEIADHLRDKKSIVLNLESTNKDVARRLVDFLSGVAYALDGKIKKVAISTYILTPYNVEIVGDLVEELENSGVYF